MKIATSSMSFDRSLKNGELTQLEWLDWCATAIPADGVVLDTRHFPRVDADYLAQVKKLAADLGLTIAAVRRDDLFDEPAPAFEIAGAVGAPLVLTQGRAVTEHPEAWAAFVSDAAQAAREAKRANIPIAVRAAAGTLASDAAALKRLAKDVDSSWLRYAIDPGTPDASDPLHGIVARSIIAVHESLELDPFGADVHADISGALRGLGSFRGFFALDYLGEGDVRSHVSTQLTWLRTMLAKETIEQHA
jgi:hypothetical protein